MIDEFIDKMEDVCGVGVCAEKGRDGGEKLGKVVARRITGS